ncbi:MAG: anthrone oxygenase family protein [Acidobacteriota bacterium]
MLCSLVAGFVYAFTVVVMPGIATLGDRAYLQAFQVMDRVIQNNQPLFLLVWVGSAVALVVSGVLGFGRLEGLDRVLLVSAVVLYVVGVQAPTTTINIPLNNQLQTLDLAAIDESTVAAARRDFETRWVHWNTIRTIVATVVALLLMVLVLRL